LFLLKNSVVLAPDFQLGPAAVSRNALSVDAKGGLRHIPAESIRP